jgi:formylglycine-generating enzyme required for sulfatase activity
MMNETPKKSQRIRFLLFIAAAAVGLFPSPTRAAEQTYRNSLGMTFAFVPAGTFLMGSPPGEDHHEKSEVLHEVTISKPFFMQTTEVTLQQWRAVMGKRFLFGRRKGKDDSPVVKVSWHDCIRFIKKLNAKNEGAYRLPTEAEWEYACKARSSGAYGWGGSIDCSLAMYGNNRGKSRQCVDYVKSRGLEADGPAPVASYEPNAWGLYDLHGNVWEWCQDWHSDLTSEPAMDPRGPDSGANKVRRGGSWFGPGHRCRCANRAYGHPASRFATTGFRLVWSTAGEEVEVQEEPPPLEVEPAFDGGP